MSIPYTHTRCVSACIEALGMVTANGTAVAKRQRTEEDGQGAKDLRHAKKGKAGLKLSDLYMHCS